MSSVAADPARTAARLARLPAARGQTPVLVLLAVLRAAALLAQALGLAWLLAGATAGELTVTGTGVLAGMVLGAAGLRALLGWASARHAARVAVAVQSQLRAELLDTARLPGAAEALASLVGGVDGLHAWFDTYRQARVDAVVIPLLVLAALAVVDPFSALTVLLTLPLLPLFGALVGAHTARRTARQWGALARLGGHFLDVLAGLPTLRAFGRAERQQATVARMAQAHRAATVGALRVAFLSALVLELVATLSVALVAVPVGLRLLGGDLAFVAALGVLFLAPEAYLPVRAAGTAFHAAAEGVRVAALVFARLDEAEAADRARASRWPVLAAGRGAALELHEVSVCYPRRQVPALREVSLRLAAGERLALTGPSGAGKSTLLKVALGLVEPTEGRIARSEVDQDGWRRQVAWVPQRPYLFARSLADNIRLARPAAGDAEVRAAAAAAAVDEFADRLPEGYDTMLGERAAGLSAGQAQRVALARAFLADRPVLVLDEPTAHLDPDSERLVLAATARLLAGRTALIVTHRPAVLGLADRVLNLHEGQLTGTAAAALGQGAA